MFHGALNYTLTANANAVVRSDYLLFFIFLVAQQRITV